MTRSLVAGLGLLLLATAASAADLPRGSAPYRAPAYFGGYNWTGFYLGINGGAGWGGSKWNGLAIDNSPTGAMIGGTAGFNWQGAGSPWVFGLEGDIAWTGFSDSVPCPLISATCETKNNWFGTIRGRVGYAFDRLMPYATGGVAFGNIEANPLTYAGASDSNVGWVVGVGLEGAINRNWTAKVEYLYADLGDIACTTAACGVATNIDFHVNILRAGVNYRF
jgi:outer membrane immunogenic protein